MFRANGLGNYKTDDDDKMNGKCLYAYKKEYKTEGNKITPRPQSRRTLRLAEHTATFALYYYYYIISDLCA